MSAVFSTMLVSVMKRINQEPGVVVHSCHLNPGEAEFESSLDDKAGGSWLKTQTKIKAATAILAGES